jgi:hypothetical protein
LLFRLTEEIMKQSEIDKLVDDIQVFLNRVSEQGGITEESFGSCATTNSETGIFIPAGSKKKMNRFLKVSRYACYLVEALTIGLLTTVIVWPLGSLPQTAMFIVGALLFGIFIITMLFGMQARVRLLLKIEANTQRIAASKARIAESLEKLQFE